MTGWSGSPPKTVGSQFKGTARVICGCALVLKHEQRRAVGEDWVRSDDRNLRLQWGCSSNWLDSRNRPGSVVRNQRCSPTGLRSRTTSTTFRPQLRLTVLSRRQLTNSEPPRLHFHIADSHTPATVASVTRQGLRWRGHGVVTSLTIQSFENGYKGSKRQIGPWITDYLIHRVSVQGDGRIRMISAAGVNQPVQGRPVRGRLISDVAHLPFQGVVAPLIRPEGCHSISAIKHDAIQCSQDDRRRSLWWGRRWWRFSHGVHPKNETRN